MSESTSFTPAQDGLNPEDIPSVELYTGAKMPAIGFGTFGSDHASADTVASALLGAVEVGYRHFDCAAVYNNEKEIGQVLKQIMAAGVPREKLWITSKLWNDKHAEKDVIQAFEQSLRNLQLDYLDLYLIHWPFPNHHPPGCDVSARNPYAKPYIHENYMKTWRQLEKLVERGLTRHIGTSNMTIPKLKLVLRDAAIKPAANEMELHPHFQQPQFFDFIRSNGIVPIAYSPLGSPNRPERDRTKDDTVDMEDPVIVEIAERHRVHPATICIQWAIHYLSNLKAATAPSLTDDEMAAIARIDRNCRLIKGHVFLWKDNQNYEDLWDVDGKIAQ